jgi:hypothetical protein
LRRPVRLVELLRLLLVRIALIGIDGLRRLLSNDDVQVRLLRLVVRIALIGIEGLRPRIGATYGDPVELVVRIDLISIEGLRLDAEHGTASDMQLDRIALIGIED